MKTKALKYLLAICLALGSGICNVSWGQGFRTLVTSIPGSLAEELYQRQAFDVDQLTVRGPIDDSDLMTIRRMVFLKYLDLSQTSLRTLPSNAFAAMRNLTVVRLPNNIRRIGHSAFEGCTMLPLFDIGSDVTEIGTNAFSNCRALSRIEIPTSVTKIGDEAFLNCVALSDVIIDGTPKIGLRAFAGCSALQTVICTSITPPDVELSAFEGTPEQKQLGVPASSIEQYRAHPVWGVLFANITVARSK